MGNTAGCPESFSSGIPSHGFLIFSFWPSPKRTMWYPPLWFFFVSRLNPEKQQRKQNKIDGFDCLKFEIDRNRKSYFQKPGKTRKWVIPSRKRKKRHFKSGKNKKVENCHFYREKPTYFSHFQFLTVTETSHVVPPMVLFCGSSEVQKNNK